MGAAYIVDSSGNETLSGQINSTSTTKETLVVPRMTDSQISLISSPSNGGLVYDTTNSQLKFYNGSSFSPVASSSSQKYVSPVTECLCASAGSLSATYANGTLGVGATLTNSGSQVALVIDGNTVSVSDRVIIAGQVSQFQNGIYTVTDTGSVSTNWVLTRATDYDQSAQMQSGNFVKSTDGIVYGNTTWVQSTSAPIVVGTTAIAFSPFVIPRLGLGSMAYQDGNSVGISGGLINGTSIGAFTASTGKFTTLEATTSITNSAFSSSGVVHNDSSGVFSSSLLVDGDITANTISNSKLNQVPANTIRGNNTGSTADIINLTPSEVSAMIGAVTTAALLDTQVGFGNSSNLLYGHGNFIYNSTSICLSIDGQGGASFDSTAILKLESNHQLLYIPSMTTSNRTSITASRGGGICYDTDLNQYFGWNASAWVILG